MKSKSENNKLNHTDFIESSVVNEIREILFQARIQAYSAINFIMVRAYWLVGRRIVIEEQNGNFRAEYGKLILKRISVELSKDFDKGLDERRIRKIRQFYLTFPFKNLWHSQGAGTANEKWHSLSAEFDNELQYNLFTRLSWSHIRQLLRLSDENVRTWYIKESAENNWKVRTLERNISSQYYQRLLSSQIKEPVIEEMKEKTARFQQDKYEFIKNPSVLEFLNLPRNFSHTENQLEKAIISNLQQFLLELGKGYAFVERQKLIRTEARDCKRSGAIGKMMTIQSFQPDTQYLHRGIS